MNWLRNKVIRWIGIDLINEQIQFRKREINYLQNTIQELQKIIKERTEYHIDVHHYTKTRSQVIMIGKFRNRDFVKCYEIDDREFKDLVDHLIHLEKYAKQGKMNAMPDVSAVINDEVNFYKS